MGIELAALLMSFAEVAVMWAAFRLHAWHWFAGWVAAFLAMSLNYFDGQFFYGHHTFLVFWQ
jgi:hypothetical protein